MFTSFIHLPKKEVIKGLIIVYIVGLIGFSFKISRDFFILLTPLNLLFSFLVLLYGIQRIGNKLDFFSLFVFLSSFAIEAIGTNTGLIFGEYQYKSALGPKLFNTPVIIGMLWLMLIYSIQGITQKIKANKWIRSLTGASLMLFYDLFLEPMAMRFEMWDWSGNLVPIQNYVSWFALSFFYFMIFNFLRIRIKNDYAMPVYLVQLGFFISLNVVFIIM